MAYTQNGMQFDDQGRWIPGGAPQGGNEWFTNVRQRPPTPRTGYETMAFLGARRPDDPQPPQPQRPGDFDQFRQNFGAGYATENDYVDWAKNQQRERTMADFVQRMATPGVQNTFQGQVNDFGGDVRAQINAPQPQLRQATMETGNRFEQGLSNAEARLNDLITNPSGLQLSPAYQFRVQQGQQALERSLGGKGMLRSGNRLMALNDYGQQAGSQEYEAEFGRRKGMYDSNAGNWLADKDANTKRYGVEQGANVAGYTAQAGAGDARLKTLGSLLTAAGGNLNQANNDRAAWGQIWTNQSPKPTPYAPTRRDYPDAPYPAYRTGWS